MITEHSTRARGVLGMLGMMNAIGVHDGADMMSHGDHLGRWMTARRKLWCELMHKSGLAIKRCREIKRLRGY